MPEKHTREGGGASGGPLDVTLTVTTCRRPWCFFPCMESLSRACRDLDGVREVLVVDDNSPAEDRARMAERHPEFRFVHKGPGETGLPRSMNIILDEVRTSRVLHVEDDWLFSHSFRIADLLSILDLDESIVEVLLCGRPCLRPRAGAGGHVWLEYVYNPDHELRTEDLEHQENGLLEWLGRGPRDPARPRSGIGWWWPGFSLNPGLWKLDVLKERIGRFREDLPPGRFELDYALRVHHHPRAMRVAVHDLGVRHLGWEVSAHALNDQSRSWDGTGGDSREREWYARYRRASDALRSGVSSSIEPLFELWRERPWRGEPLWDLVTYHHVRDDHAAVCLFAREGSLLERPGDEKYGVNHEIYEWRFLDMLCTHLYYIGRYEEGLECFDRLESRDVPPVEMARIASNRRFYEETPGRE